MERFRGQALPARPRLAVLASEKPGNFVIASTVLRGLRERFPDCTIDYFVDGERSNELITASPLIDASWPAQRAGPELGAYDLGVSSDQDTVFAEAMARLAPRYVAGPCLGLPELPDRIGALWADTDWNRPDLLEEFGDLLGSQYMGEIWCRLASLDTDFFRTEVPTADPGAVPDVLMATGGTNGSKIWPPASWRAVVRRLRADGLTVGLVGIDRALQARYYGAAVEDDDRLVAEGVIDLRGRWSLPQVAGACRAARAVVTIDNAIGHIAAAVRAPTVIVWGGSPWRIWAPRGAHVRNLLPDEPAAGTAGVRPARVLAELGAALRSGAIA
jgi:heptosyltransferase-3